MTEFVAWVVVDTGVACRWTVRQTRREAKEAFIERMLRPSRNTTGRVTDAGTYELQCLRSLYENAFRRRRFTVEKVIVGREVAR